MPRWARAYRAYEQRAPNHPGKRTFLRIVLRTVARVRPRPFAWRMANGAVLAISPLEGIAFAWTVGWTCFQTEHWEPHVERCIRRLLEPGDTAVDVGANLGYFTAVMAQRVGVDGRVWAFEPVPATFERLCLSVALNDFGQVAPLPLALGDASGTARMAFDPRFAGSASLHGGAGSQTVAVRGLDELVADGTVRPPRLIKIDVEGHELAVIRGAVETIGQAHPFIVFEFSEPLARAGGWTLPEIAATLTACGDYRFFDIRDDGLHPIRDLAAYAPEAERYGADLLAACGPLPGSDDGVFDAAAGERTGAR